MSVITQFPVEEEYKKKNGITPRDIAKLRDWLRTRPHLPEKYITDLDLILTYHCCERSAEVAKQVLDVNLTLRSLFHILGERHVDAKMIETADVVLATPLAVRSHEGYSVFYCRLIDYDVKKFVFSNCVKYALMNFDLWQFGTGTWPGLSFIIDLDGVTLAHLTRLDVQTVQQFLYYLQEAMLVKLKNFHFLNAPSFMDKLMFILRPFMKKALLDMLTIHQVGARTLDKFMPMEGLPKESGGSYKSFQEAKEECLEKLKANKEYFEQENLKRVTESARPGQPKTITDIFGSVEGSFKKLDID